jgi:cytoskeletal protein CcmA (bactofilin family)
MNVVGEKSMLVGSFNCEEDLLVAGRFEGSIVTKGTLHVYTAGEVKGTVQAHNLTVEGSIQGEVQVRNRLKVKNSASLEAHIRTRFLDWEEGAKLEGELNSYY